MEDIYHLFPVEDTRTHKECENCPCNPSKVKNENGDTIIIHNAFDGRELLEKAEKRIKTENN